MTKSRNLIAVRRPWTPIELDLLRDLYPDVPCADIAALLERHPGSVYYAATSRGLQKSDEFHASDLSGRILRGKIDPRMVAGRFKPGMTPWNTGIRYVAGGRSAETRFKPGTKPAKTAPVGAYRLLKEKTGKVHLERKTSETSGPNHMRWTPVSRLVWEAANGPVPDGHLVVFKRGMHTAVLEEITLDRVECISRAEHARRNHPAQRDPELAKLIQLKGAITRQVNRINKEAQERTAT